jgi:maleylpyruvate isomerase
VEVWRYGLPAMTPDVVDHVAGCQAAHRRLIDHLHDLVASGALTDDVVRSPSRLPGWSVGHVLAHLARNADSHTRVIDGAGRGEVLTQYEGGTAQRAADIDRDAARPAAVHVADVESSAATLEAAWARAREWGWNGRWITPFEGDVPIDSLPMRRWREVEIHHADLGFDGFGVDDWSPAYVRNELRRRTMEWTSRQPMGMATLPSAALALAPNTRLAWLMGRVVPDGLEPVPFG